MTLDDIVRSATTKMNASERASFDAATAHRGYTENESKMIRHDMAIMKGHGGCGDLTDQWCACALAIEEGLDSTAMLLDKLDSHEYAELIEIIASQPKGEKPAKAWAHALQA